MSFESRLQAAWVRRGGAAWSLLPLSWLYRAVLIVRSVLYGVRLLRSRSLPVPVVVVGNLVAGGAGKTPTVMALVSLLRAKGWEPGVISRGYGRRDAGLLAVDSTTPAVLSGDEPLLIHLRTGAPVVVGSDRVAAGRELLRLHPSVNLIVSDDGLQHRRLKRDVQVIVFDERGAGNGWLLPAGPLREPMPATPPPRSVIVYNAAAATTPLPGQIVRRRLVGIAALSQWWAGEAPRLETLIELAGRPVLAAAGMARPQRFFDMLRAAGLQITPLPLPDHYDFAALPWPADTADVVVTEKDAVKLQPQIVDGARVWVATLDFDLPATTRSQLLELLPPAPALPTRNDHGHPTA